MNTQASPKDKPVYHNMCKDETSRIRNFKDRKVGLPPSCLGYFGIALQEIEATVGWDRGVVCCRFGRWMLDCMGSKRWGSARISGWRGTEHTEHRGFSSIFWRTQTCAMILVASHRRWHFHHDWQRRRRVLRCYAIITLLKESEKPPLLESQLLAAVVSLVDLFDVHKFRNTLWSMGRSSWVATPTMALQKNMCQSTEIAWLAGQRRQAWFANVCERLATPLGIECGYAENGGETKVDLVDISNQQISNHWVSKRLYPKHIIIIRMDNILRCFWRRILGLFHFQIIFNMAWCNSFSRLMVFEIHFVTHMSLFPGPVIQLWWKFPDDEGYTVTPT